MRSPSSHRRYLVDCKSDIFLSYLTGHVVFRTVSETIQRLIYITKYQCMPPEITICNCIVTDDCHSITVKPSLRLYLADSSDRCDIYSSVVWSKEILNMQYFIKQHSCRERVSLWLSCNSSDLLSPELLPPLRCSRQMPGRPSPASMSLLWKLSSTWVSIILLALWRCPTAWTMASSTVQLLLLVLSWLHYTTSKNQLLNPVGLYLCASYIYNSAMVALFSLTPHRTGQRHCE